MGVKREGSHKQYHKHFSLFISNKFLKEGFMRSKISVFLMVVLVVGLFALTTLAQTKEQKSQPFAIWDVAVYPSKYMEFEAPHKDLVALLTKYECPFPMTVYRTSDFHYYFLIPIEDLAGHEKVLNYFSKLAKDAEKEFEAIQKNLDGTYESETLGVVIFRTDLSYSPKKQRVKTEDVNFVWWNYYYIKPGKEIEAEKIAREYQALWGSKKISEYFNVYQYFIGPDIPALVSAGGALSAADYYSHMEKSIKKMGEEYLALSKKSMDICRKFEQKTGRILLELSYVPIEK